MWFFLGLIIGTVIENLYSRSVDAAKWEAMQKELNELRHGKTTPRF
jgi:uncharacterized membrane protein (DUF106 family)